ncbi:hypothetical protein PSYAC_16321 [Pseudomonas syringae pv. actinidiae str. M302091]|nr:hypothetical protein PSYAC_16321 [Pseudomonas syringae pv. actinidiae str. M302091]
MLSTLTFMKFDIKIRFTAKMHRYRFYSLFQTCNSWLPLRADTIINLTITKVSNKIFPTRTKIRIMQTS